MRVLFSLIFVFLMAVPSYAECRYFTTPSLSHLETKLYSLEANIDELNRRAGSLSDAGLRNREELLKKRRFLLEVIDYVLDYEAQLSED